MKWFVTFSNRCTSQNRQKLSGWEKMDTNENELEEPR